MAVYRVSFVAQWRHRVSGTILTSTRKAEYTCWLTERAGFFVFCFCGFCVCVLFFPHRKNRLDKLRLKKKKSKLHEPFHAVKSCSDCFIFRTPAGIKLLMLFCCNAHNPLVDHTRVRLVGRPLAHSLTLLNHQWMILLKVWTRAEERCRVWHKVEAL